MNKQDLDEYFVNNVEHIKKKAYSYGWRNKNNKDDSAEIISFLYIHLYDNMDKIESYKTIKEFEVFLFSMMYNQLNWKISQYKKSLKDTFTKYNDRNDIYMKSLSELAREDEPFAEIEMSWENVSLDSPDSLKEHITYLISKGMSHDSISKICSALMASMSLSLHERSLFELYFLKDMSTREIAKLTKIPTTSVHVMLSNMKTKVRNISKDMLQ